MSILQGLKDSQFLIPIGSVSFSFPWAGEVIVSRGADWNHRLSCPHGIEALASWWTYLLSKACLLMPIVPDALTMEDFMALKIKTLTRSLCLAGTLAILAGCGGSVGRLVDPAGAPPPRAILAVTDQGVSGLTSETSYGPKAIGSAMPGYVIETIQTAGENGTQWTYAAFLDGLQMVQIFKGTGGKIGVVHGVGDAIAGPNGERLGMTFSQARLPRSACRVGKNLWRGMAICKAPNTKSVSLVFAISGYTGPFDRLPAPDALAGATLQRILWTP